MKLLRVGEKGAEKPALLHSDGTYRDLSSVVPDITGKTIDSAGLGMLMRCYTHAVRNAGVLKLVHPAAQVKQVLSMTRIDSVVATFEDENAALQSFS